MYKIRHKATGKYLSEFGRSRCTYNWRPSTDFYVKTIITKNGRTWKLKYAVEKVMKRVERMYPGQFELVSYELIERSIENVS